MQFDRGYLSPYFINNAQSQQVELENPLILITDKKISTIRELLPILEGVAKSGRPLMIVAEDVQGEARKSVVQGKSVSVRLDRGGRGLIKKTKKIREQAKQP